MYHPVINIGVSNDLPIFFDIVQVGCGGNGGYLVQHLSKMLHAFSQQNLKFSYILVDGDRVEPNNLLRQPFIEEDLYQYKAEVLASRYSEVYGFTIYHKNRYVESVDDILSCFLGFKFNHYYIPILIGCVDNNATRQLMHQAFYKMDHMIYLDAGVEGVNTSFPEHEQNETGYSGQVVCGYRERGNTLLAPVGEVYENILSDQDSPLPTQACGLTVVNYPQRMQTNELAALVLAGYLNTILGDQTIVTHFTNFNARTMFVKPTYIRRND